MRSLHVLMAIVSVALCIGGTPVEILQTSDGRRIAVLPAEASPELVRKLLLGEEADPRQVATGATPAAPLVDAVQFGGLGAVLFAFDSAELGPHGEETLKQICIVFRDASFHSVRVLLTGHTDAVGAARYNLLLSRARAEAAARVLARCLGKGRVSHLGRGESEHIEGVAPTDARQRRVEVSVLPERLELPERRSVR